MRAEPFDISNFLLPIFFGSLLLYEHNEVDEKKNRVVVFDISPSMRSSLFSNYFCIKPG